MYNIIQGDEKMELRNLYYFVVTAEELNITRAAERLTMTQPPLSNSIKSLEEELGVSLFIRGKRKLTLTDEGKALLKRARQILELTDRTVEEMKSMESGMRGTLSIAMVEGRAPFFASRWIAGFCEEFPTVRYNLWNGSSDDVIERLRHGLADVGVIAAPFDAEHLESIFVGAEQWVAFISKDHPLASYPGDKLPLRMLSGERLIIPSRKSRIDALHRWFDEAGAELSSLCEMSNYLDAIALAERNIGIGIFPQTTYTPNPLVVTKIISESSRQIRYFLVWNKERGLNELTSEFINFVRDMLESEEEDDLRPDMPTLIEGSEL